MTIKDAIQILKKDRDLCLYNPMTGEQKPMNEDCRRSAEAYDIILNELQRRGARHIPGTYYCPNCGACMPATFRFYG